MIGNERMRLPVAEKIAFATTATTGRAAGSPAPPQISPPLGAKLYVDFRRLGERTMR